LGPPTKGNADKHRSQQKEQKTTPQKKKKKKNKQNHPKNTERKKNNQKTQQKKKKKTTGGGGDLEGKINLWGLKLPKTPLPDCRAKKLTKAQRTKN